MSPTRLPTLCMALVTLCSVEAFAQGVAYDFTRIETNLPDTVILPAVGAFLPGVLGAELSVTSYALPAIFVAGQAGFATFSYVASAEQAEGILSPQLYARGKFGIGRQNYKMRKDAVELSRSSAGDGYDKVTSLVGAFPKLSGLALYGSTEARSYRIQRSGGDIAGGTTLSVGGGLRIENATDFEVQVQDYGERAKRSRNALDVELHYGLNALWKGLGATLRFEFDVARHLGLVTEFSYVFVGRDPDVDTIDALRASVLLSIPIGLNIASRRAPVDLECVNSRRQMSGCESQQQ